MSLRTAKAFTFRLVCNGVQLDTFQDEEITVSDNVTGLFDVGELPSDFTRQIMLPGTKKNNAFFEHVYDISVTNPYLWKTNVKVEAYFDFDGILVSQGYLQLNSVNMLNNNRVDSYEVTVFGLLSSFARDINKTFLTDLTSLSIYNHTSSIYNIEQSWSGSNGGLFDGDIVYPLVDYGQAIAYQSGVIGTGFGIDTDNGALSVQDFKPAIRVKKVFDAIFEQFGYNYEGEFLSSSFFDNEYMVCDNGFKTPFYPGFGVNGLDTFNQVQLAPISGSSTVIMAPSTWITLPYQSIEFDPYNIMSSGSLGPLYSLQRQSPLECTLKLNFQVTGSVGIPQFTFRTYTTASTFTEVDLPQINSYLRQQNSVNGQTGAQVYTLTEKFKTSKQNINDLYFSIGYTTLDGTDFLVILNPNGNTEGRFTVDKLTEAADYRIMDIPANMPFGENGIKCVDFIKGIQKKYNLVIYPSKTKPRTFIVETFNEWYKTGEILDFNKYINLTSKISVTPANNLAVNQLNFQDKLDNDFICQQFKKKENRDYGKQFYNDTTNFFSQGKFEVETTFSSSPLRYITGTGITGSDQGTTCSEWGMFCPSGVSSDGCIYSYIDCGGGLESGVMPNDSDQIICALDGTTPTLFSGVLTALGQPCSGSI